ncbi:hypothetical protein QQF64_025375, partial [Cirrhinus molitorella]
MTDFSISVPRAVLSVSPQKWLTEGDPVTLICEVDGSSTGWTFSWFTQTVSSVGVILESPVHPVAEKDTLTLRCLYKHSPNLRADFYKDGSLIQSQTTEMIISTVSKSHEGFYYCKHPERGESPKSWISVRDKAVLSVSPQKWLTEGDPVTLICEVDGSSTGWTFSWFTETVSSGVSPPVSLIISPSRTQHFTLVSLSLSCEDQSNSDRWTVRRYTDWLQNCSSSYLGSQTGSTCTISFTSTSDTGVYWCQSESGENSHPVNITVHFGVILESPVHPVTEGDTLTLRCLYQHSPNLRADFYKDGSLIQSQTTEMIISTVSKSHEGFYYCKHPERGESPKSWISVRERPKSKVTIKPAQHVFRGETVSLRCDIDGEGVTSWQYSWYKDGSLSVFSELQEHTFSPVTEFDAGKYSCYGAKRGGSPRSQDSDAVTLTVSDLVLSVSPQKWLTEGDPVTLICGVIGSSTGWTFSWYTLTVSSDYSNRYKLLSDSSRGAGGNYAVSSAALNHTGVYVCTAERGKPDYKTWYSNKQLIWVTDVSPPVSLIISPSRTQHFTSVSVSLSCEDQSNSDRWTVRRYTDNEQLEDCSSSVWGSQTGSTCTISSTITSDTGVYWCQSESGENSHPVNITVHFGVILESPVHPVTEGDTLTLGCLFKHSTPPNLRADFYKDGSLIQSQTTEMIISNVSKSHEGFYYCKQRGESPKSWISVRAGVILESPVHPVTEGDTLTLRCLYKHSTNLTADFYKDGSLIQNQTTEMIISTVSKSHEGFYYCKHPERGESPKSWISVRVSHSESQISVLHTLSSVLAVCPYLLVTLVLIFKCCKMRDVVLSVSPQKWLTEGDPVTLICEVDGSSTGWTFSWYTITVDSSDHYQLLSDSSSGAGGNYTVSSAALKHTGVYVCTAERENPPYNTRYSNKQLIWVTVPAELNTSHLVSLSLSCEDQSNSDRWTVRRYTDNEQLEDCSSSVWGSQTGSTCTISSTSTSDTGVYWCQSESGENSHPVNITVHSGVILESPVHPVTEGDTLTLHCLDKYSTSPNLRAVFYKDGSLIQSQTTEMIISNVSKSQEGFYYCKHPERGESPKSWISVREQRPKAKVTIKPDHHVYRGDTVTLRCDIDGKGAGSWRYSWYKDGSVSVFSELQEHTFRSVAKSDAGKYSCYGAKRGGSPRSKDSDAVTLTVSNLVLSVSPQKWLTEGDPVTLICGVDGSSTGWTFSWFTITVDRSDHYKLLSDSSRGAGGNYTVSSAALNHTGVYLCRAERGEPDYKTWYSNTQLIWVTGVSPPVSLIISPSRTQHFTLDSLSLSCEDQSNSDRWTVRRYTDSGRLEDCSSLHKGSQTGSTCTISSTSTWDTGVYWCQSESGENSQYPVNITVHFGVILESPVHPVTEGDTLTLHCLYKYSTSPNLRADFYKDGSLIQNQTTEMIISTVSKSHEGFYYCKHPKRGESPKSWISVR